MRNPSADPVLSYLPERGFPTSLPLIRFKIFLSILNLAHSPKSKEDTGRAPYPSQPNVVFWKIKVDVGGEPCRDINEGYPYETLGLSKVFGGGGSAFFVSVHGM